MNQDQQQISAGAKIRSAGLNDRGANTRGKIIAEARKQIMENGLKATAPATITTALEIPRPLFYHYFNNMDELADLVLEMEIAEYQKILDKWASTYTPGDFNDAVDSGIRIWRSVHESGHLFGGPSPHRRNGDLYSAFMDEFSNRIARFVVERVVPGFFEAACAERPNAEAEMIKNLETYLYFLFQGVNAVMRNKPELSDAELKVLVAQALRIEDYLTFDA